MNIVQIVE